MAFSKGTFGNSLPDLTYTGPKAMGMSEPRIIRDRLLLDRARASNEGDDMKGGDMDELPKLPDFSKRPKIMHPTPTPGYSVTDNYEECRNHEYVHNQPNTLSSRSAFDPTNHPDNSGSTRQNHNPNHQFYQMTNASNQSRNASVLFFSDGANDEHTYNELPLNEELDDFDYEDDDDYDDEDSKNEGRSLILPEKDEDDGNRAQCSGYSTSRPHTPDPYYSSLGKNINRAESPFLPMPTKEYSSEIPPFYDSSKLNYPYKSPLDYSDEEFEHMNHFDFLKELNLSVPPLLPVYLNSNLLNDSSSKNYKTFPYQYQESTVPHVNEIYRYRINDLNLMDKYSTHKSTRPVLKRSSSSNSSNSSTLMQRSTTGSSKLINKARLMRENSNNSIKTTNKLKHSDKINLIERNLVPHHVMLNHLITCNLKKDGYITSSCITRYKGKFITQIMYFSNDIEKL